MRRIFFVALAFVVLFHFVQVAATRRARRAKGPGTFGASPSLEPRVFDPDHLSHKRFLGLVLSSPAQQFPSRESQFILWELD
jgi:hypothetical protein